MKDLKVIAFTHKNLSLEDIGSLVIDPSQQPVVLSGLKTAMDIEELFLISTCNRVELVFKTAADINNEFIKTALILLQPTLSTEKINRLIDQIEFHSGLEALNHLMRVSSSLESMVVGEKEILAQVREMYENCRNMGLNGDYLRLVMQRVVKGAKEVYSNTKIADKPVSIVSLAYRKLKDLELPTNARFIFIGAGETNQLLSKYLTKHGFGNITVFNRTLEKAQHLARELKGTAYPLSEISTFKGGFDVIVTCTAATEPIITPELYQHLLQGESSRKVIIDLAIPNDTDSEVLKNFNVHFINIEQLQDIATENLKERKSELKHAEQVIAANLEEFPPLLNQRKLELAMQEVPEKIKEIRHRAMNSVFAKELQGLDENSLQVLEKVINYMEKKYISVPMVMAKDILLNVKKH